MSHLLDIIKPLCGFAFLDNNIIISDDCDDDAACSGYTVLVRRRPGVQTFNVLLPTIYRTYHHPPMAYTPFGLGVYSNKHPSYTPFWVFFFPGVYGVYANLDYFFDFDFCWHILISHRNSFVTNF